jgi:hypothetical protein
MTKNKKNGYDLLGLKKVSCIVTFCLPVYPFLPGKINTQSIKIQKARKTGFIFELIFFISELRSAIL